jgi:hypothetical protein
LRLKAESLPSLRGVHLPLVSDRAVARFEETERHR